MSQIHIIMSLRAGFLLEIQNYIEIGEKLTDGRVEFLTNRHLMRLCLIYFSHKMKSFALMNYATVKLI